VDELGPTFAESALGNPFPGVPGGLRLGVVGASVGRAWPFGVDAAEMDQSVLSSKTGVPPGQEEVDAVLGDEALGLGIASEHPKLTSRCRWHMLIA
jgi:hypothetical protein